jgi:hypothetical protein
MTSRVLACLFAVAAHIALIALLASHRAIDDEASDDGSGMVFVILARDSTPMSAEPVTPSSRRLRAAKQTADRASVFSDDGRSISELPRQEIPTLPSIDWSLESELAAQRQVDAVEAARRRGRGFPAYDEDRKLAATAPPAPEFGWDRARTHRIEPIPTGGTIIHINDRCFVVISGLIMPVCKLGKIEARGDLFEHMDDTPRLGDAK